MISKWLHALACRLHRPSPARTTIAREIRLDLELLECKRLLVMYHDTGVAQLMSRYYADQQLSRAEVISLLQSTADNGGLEVNELRDIRTMCANAAMPNHVRSLTKNLLDSPANAAVSRIDLNRLSDQALPASTVMRLIDKWFYGKERPLIPSTAEYRSVAGQLFVGGASRNDVDQGKLGNCWLMASLAAVADKFNSNIREMFIDNQDSTFTVRFYRFTGRTYVEDYVTVDRFLPVAKTTGRAVFAEFGRQASDSKNELWVALAEKAYAQWNQSGFAQRGSGKDGQNDYAALAGGSARVALGQITGSAATRSAMSTTSAQFVIQALAEGAAVIVSRYMNAAGTSRHAYVITGFERGEFLLQNPWGHSHLRMNWQQMESECYRFAILRKASARSASKLPGAMAKVSPMPGVVQDHRPEFSGARLSTVA